MTRAILHSALSEAPWMTPAGARLPGIEPASPGDWLRVDEAYGAQMELRERLLAECAPGIIARLPDPATSDALDELSGLVEAELPGLGFSRGGLGWICPDGREVCDDAPPLERLCRLVQEDFCILRPDGAGSHVLNAAVVAFPASWLLSEKLGRKLVEIHGPVAAYDAGLAARVDRLFNAIRPGQVLCRSNALVYDDPALFQPRSAHDPRTRRAPGARSGGYLRSERQCLRRLEHSGAVVFSIHTVVVALSALSAKQRAALPPG